MPTAGSGHGLTFKETFGILGDAAGPQRRVISHYDVGGYGGTAPPVLGAGFAVGRVGLCGATVVFAAIIGATAMVAIACLVGPGTRRDRP